MPRRPFCRWLRECAPHARRSRGQSMKLKLVFATSAAAIALLPCLPCAAAAQAAPAPLPRLPKRPMTACSACSRKATKPAQAQPDLRASSAATCATPTSSATISATNITPARRAAAEADLAALRAIDRASLDATDQLAYDVFEFTTKDTLRGLSARTSGADQGPPDQPFLRASTPSIRPFPAARARRRSRRSPTMTTS